MNKQQRLEDDILALDLYFRLSECANAQIPIQEMATKINVSITAIITKLARLRRLNTLDNKYGASGATQQLRDVWNQYCYDESTMREMLIKNPALSYAAACQDLDELQKDARRIIKKRKVSRREVRQALAQILYAAHLQNIGAQNAAEQWRDSRMYSRSELVYADSFLRQLLDAVVLHYQKISALLTSGAGRLPTRISEVEKAVLYMALAEWLINPQMERQIIINEAVEIAKSLGSAGGHKIVNGVLDAIIKQSNSRDA